MTKGSKVRVNEQAHDFATPYIGQTGALLGTDHEGALVLFDDGDAAYFYFDELEEVA